MQNKKTLVICFLAGLLFLLPNFYNNRWKAVDESLYSEWQTRYDRLVIARLVQSKQDGFFSAGGLLGLGDVTKWSYSSATHKHQFNIYLTNGKFDTYLPYKSNPGFQGIFYGVPDMILGASSALKIRLFRATTALLSASIIGLFAVFVASEFGFIAWLFVIIFSGTTIWMVLPAGSIFWNLWAFYLPFITCGYLFKDPTKGAYSSKIIYLMLFLTTLLRILLSGFDLMTTGLIMTVVPLIYFSIVQNWGVKIFLARFLKLSIVLIAATATGLTIMATQIGIAENNTANIFRYFEDRFGHHFAGNSEYYLNGNIEATKIGVGEVIQKYLVIPAINLRIPGDDIQILFWHIILIFGFFTLFYLFMSKGVKNVAVKANALIFTTWFSLSAPLSWLIIFRPHSIIHTHVNSMGWQMPFTLLGFALCGFIVSELFQKKNG